MSKLEKHSLGPTCFYAKALLFGPFATTNNDPPSLRLATQTLELVQKSNKEKNKGEIRSIKCGFVIFKDYTGIRIKRILHKSNTFFRKRHITDKVFQIEQNLKYVIFAVYDLADGTGPAYLVFKFENAKVAQNAFKELNEFPVRSEESKEKKAMHSREECIQTDFPDTKGKQGAIRQRIEASQSAESYCGSPTSLFSASIQTKDKPVNSKEEEVTCAPDKLSRSFSDNEIDNNTVEKQTCNARHFNSLTKDGIVHLLRYEGSTPSLIPASSMQLEMSGTYLIIGGQRYTYSELAGVLKTRDQENSDSD